LCCVNNDKLFAHFFPEKKHFRKVKLSFLSSVSKGRRFPREEEEEEDAAATDRQCGQKQDKKTKVLLKSKFGLDGFVGCW
jgi:hypothetical protein